MPPPSSSTVSRHWRSAPWATGSRWSRRSPHSPNPTSWSWAAVSRSSTRSLASTRKAKVTADAATSARNAGTRSPRCRSRISRTTRSDDGAVDRHAAMSRVYVAPISFGLGDLVVSLPVVQALIAQARRTGGETWLVARSSAQTKLAERIEGLGGCVDEDTFDSRASGDRFVDLRDHPLQRDYWWGSPEFEQAFGPLSINEILGRICADFGIDAKFARPVPLTTRPRPELRSSVLFVTESDGPSKRWSAQSWASLAQSI